MIIKCINCTKKFDVNSELIPSSGRTIQCGSCNHIWFFNPAILKTTKDPGSKIFKEDKIEEPKKTNFEKKIHQNIKKTKINTNKITSKENEKNYQLAPYKSKSSFSLAKFLSYIIVFIISFIALIVVIDTFKSPIYKIFPDLEIMIFSLFETLKDIELFIKDLI